MEPSVNIDEDLLKYFLERNMRVQIGVDPSTALGIIYEEKIGRI